jgi:hypothetical protein
MIRAIIACVAAGLVCPAIVGARAIEPSGAAADPARSVQQFLTANDTPLVSYRAYRVLEAETRGGRMRARLCACTELDPFGAFRYTIVEQSGSDIIRRWVLHAALDAERTMRENGEIAKGELTTANYDFGDDSAPSGGLVRVALRPKRQDTLLVAGSMLLTLTDADLVRVEGLLSKRPSFWTRRVDVVRQYSRIDGVRVPVNMSSTAQVLLVGPSKFSMSYEYESINGRTLPPGNIPHPCEARLTGPLAAVIEAP